MRRVSLTRRSESARPSTWQRTRRLAIVAVAAVCVLALLVPLAAPMLEAVAVLGMPLSYYAGSQGIPIALVIVVLAVLMAQRRIDRAPGIQEPGAVVPGADEPGA